MIVRRGSQCVQVPWKNGGGMTREILREPPEPTAFDWRLSLATIAESGPFSSFVGYRRTLLLVEGAGIELDFGPHGKTRLEAKGQSVSFDGAWPTSCTVLDGTSTDLNLMASQQRVEFATSSCSLTEPRTIQTTSWQETLVCCIAGSVRVTNGAGECAQLGGVDVARCGPGDNPLTCTPTPQALLFVAHIKERKD